MGFTPCCTGRVKITVTAPATPPAGTQVQVKWVKFQAPNRPVLTTQFYFPGERGNAADAFFHPELVMKIATAGERTGRFDTVLDIA